MGRGRVVLVGVCGGMDARGWPGAVYGIESADDPRAARERTNRCDIYTPLLAHIDTLGTCD